MRKFWNSIRLFFISLAWGMRGADKIISNSNKENEGGDISGIEQQKSQESVYANLLRGEVTQEVKEFRHEMYYAERKSHEYVYAGGGHAVKKNKIFDYKGNIDRSDGLKVQIVQDNREDMSSLIENGIYSQGTEFELSEQAKGDLKEKERRDFTIKIERDFFPSFRIEQYATKIVVKRGEDGSALLDIYIWSEPRQFDNRHKLFLSAIKKIVDGDRHSDIIDFDNLSFITYNAYGAENLKYFSYDNIHFCEIIPFDGNYVLKFTANVVNDGEDLIQEFYNEIAAEKSKNHEARKNAPDISLESAIEAIEEENYDFDQAKDLMKELKNEEQ